MTGNDAEHEIDVMPGTHVLRASGTTLTVTAIVGQVVPVTIVRIVTESVEAPPVVPAASPSSVSAVPIVSPADVARRRHSAKWPVVASFGAGAAVAYGGGVTFALLSQHETSVGAAMRATMQPGICSNREAPGCQALSDQIHRANTSFVTSWALYGTAAGLALTTTALLLFWPRKPLSEPARGTWVLPVVGPGTVGLAGSF